jgi:hypothetical protein
MSADDGIGSKVEDVLGAEPAVSGGVAVFQEQGERVVGSVNDSYIPWPIKDALGWNSGTVADAAEYIARMRKATQDTVLPKLTVMDYAEQQMLEIGRLVGLEFEESKSQFCSVSDWALAVRKRVAGFVKVNNDVQAFVDKHTPKL